MLQDRIKKNIEYFRGIEVIEDKVIIKVQYGDRWGAFPSKDNKIKVAKSESSVDEWFYYAQADEVEFDEIFDLIEQTIEMNLNAYIKLELLTKKIEELKEIFSSTSLKKLETLKFVMDEIVDKPKKRKYTRRKKDVVENIENKEDKIENTDDNK